MGGQTLAGLLARELAQSRLRRMGFIFQSYNLCPALTTAKNVQVALELKGRDLGEAPALLDLVGLAKRRRNFPA